VPDRLRAHQVDEIGEDGECGHDEISRGRAGPDRFEVGPAQQRGQSDHDEDREQPGEHDEVVPPPREESLSQVGHRPIVVAAPLIRCARAVPSAARVEDADR
jgi:hypothetical protein